MEQRGGRMTIAGIAVVRNEQDIIEPFVRHNMKYLDVLAIMDNGSVDRTKEILGHLSVEFKGLALWHDDNFADEIASRANRLLRWCETKYVVPLDADEFIEAESRDEFENYLSQIPFGGYGIVPWKTFVMYPHGLGSVYRARARELPQFNKVIVRTEGQDVKNIVLHTGSHEVSAQGREMESVVLPTHLRHLPVRSYEQIVGKACIGWLAYHAHNPKARETVENYHKREMFDKIVSGEPLDINRISLMYAQDEREIDWHSDVTDEQWDYAGKRKYSDGNPMPAMHLILKSVEQWMAGGVK